mmetsp:Transcript_37420/g.6721  ORF Transcript_37420/g.6721 Transcript_37420/m.6721 type:complete len:160 (+) Transcript_37420:1938-2417(+)
MWITLETLDYIDFYYVDSKEDILKVMNGAIGLDYRPHIVGEEGNTFSADFQAAYGYPYSTFGMYVYDSMFLYARTIAGMTERGEDFNTGKELTDSLRAADYSGASGKVKFAEGTNNRSAFGYSIINFVDGEFIKVREYDPLNPNMFIDSENKPIVWGGD